MPRPLFGRGCGLQGQDWDFLGGKGPSDAIFRVRIPAALMQLWTMLVRHGAAGRPCDAAVELHDLALSLQAASTSDALAAEGTCRPQCDSA